MNLLDYFCNKFLIPEIDYKYAQQLVDHLKLNNSLGNGPNGAHVLSPPHPITHEYSVM